MNFNRTTTMKRIFLPLAAVAMMLCGCGSLGQAGSSSATSGILGNVVDVLSNGTTISNVIGSVLGTDKLSSADLVGTWHYSAPGVAFTSDKALANAGGEVVAAQIKEKLKPSYQKLGITASNTSITLGNDSTYSAKIGGKSLSGRYTFNEKENKIVLQGLLLNITGYTKRNGTGISLLFESKKLLTLLQTVSALSGNESVQAIGEISKNYNDIRLGFDLAK